MTAKTRRQKAAFTNQTDEIDSVPSTNGTVDTKKSNKSGSPAAAQGNVKENVFLFAPNLIGTKSSLSLFLLPVDVLFFFHQNKKMVNFVLTVLVWVRIFANHPRSGLPLLHAASSANLLSALQHLVPSRCIGRICRADL